MDVRPEQQLSDRGPLVRVCVHCGRLSKNHFGRSLTCKPAMGRLRFKAGPERHLYDVQGYPPERSPTIEVEGTVEVDGILHTFPVRVWTEIPHKTSPHHGARYVHFRFPSNAVVDIAPRFNMETKPNGY